MAANKFATMLHRNTNQMTLILVYTLLEWILIALLLLNSLFSYLIIKFADYFGLQPPCPWCSRLDHIIEPTKSTTSHRDRLCEAHATEISQLGFCFNHRKLAESRHMCEDCGFSGDSEKIELIQSYGSATNCSCCGADLYSPRVLIKPDWDDLDETQKVNVVAETEDVEESNSSLNFWADRCLIDMGTGEKDENRLIPVVNEVSDAKQKVTERNWDFSVSDEKADEEHAQTEEEKDPSSDNPIQTREATSMENHPQLLEFFLGQDGYNLIPVELIDSTAEESQNNRIIEEEEGEDGEGESDSESGNEARVNPVDENWSCLVDVEDAELEVQHSAAPEIKEDEEGNYGVYGSMEIEENENSFIFHPKQCEAYPHVDSQTFPKENSDIPAGKNSMNEATEEDVQITGNNSINEDTEEEEVQMPITEIEADVSIGTEIPDLDFQIHEDIEEHDHGHNEDDRKPVPVERECNVAVETSVISEPNEVEDDDRVPDTPTSSTDSFHHLHKKLLLLDRKEPGAEESLDDGGSVISEFEAGETTVDRLKSALKAERKALHILYSELEEERSASAVAANQTMAMINRLQEEKAAMQMEALQYQRMMDEQSEYDQEALQLLNELMVKREREKQELEKELESCRKKLLEYETKEKMRFLRRSKDGGSSSITRSDSLSPSTCSSSSNAGDSDGLSIDLSHETKEEDTSTPIDAVLILEDSLANFEEERMSILEELKALEEKLFTLTDEEDEQRYEDIKPIEEFYKANGMHLSENSDSIIGKDYNEARILGVKGKRLLPLFDAISSEEAEENVHSNGFDPDIMQQNSTSKGIEEEVDRLYERLHAFEADREFLKHCIGSLKKGEKGIDLLQEILQHLRDLKNVELRVRNLSDGALV